MIPQRYEPAVVIDSLVEHPDNARRGDEEMIDASMAEHGFYGAVVVQESNRHIIVGNHRTRVARRRGESTVPVLYLDVDDDQARRIMLMDNRSNDLASYDDTALYALLAELDGLDRGLVGTGFGRNDIDVLSRLLESVDTTPPSDRVGPLPAKPRARTGDLYTLGAHRLLCGDATDPDDVARVLDGITPKLMVTDPPYLIDYTGDHRPNASDGRKQGKNWADTYDDPEPDAEFYTSFLRCALAHLAPSSLVYQWHAIKRTDLIAEAWGANGLLWHTTVFWHKSPAVLVYGDFMFAVEPCAYGWVQGTRPALTRRPPSGVPNVWQLPREMSGIDEHPTIKPVQVYSEPYSWHLRNGEWAFDPFSGSGTAIVAGETTGRRVAAIDIQPAYIDVACARWQRLTTELPLLDGEPVDFLGPESAQSQVQPSAASEEMSGSRS